ncbi:hypothetical protein BOX15_Mlig009088g1 [Macrostomum lignano]|uniref:Uncharacterized protein n=2 Tax=Macrostomum lignano TaxID=282301 RepID=A0A267HBA3_9PLAT|nr:hypothetical protein BOX15_Mlig009088g1 [Macrostomum lignano]
MSNFNPLLTMEACVYVKSSIPSMSKWKDVCLVLMPDSTLGWYKINRKLIGSVKLSSVCKYLCVGHMAKAITKAPKLPRDADLNQLLGVPIMCEPVPDKMHWFCFDHVKHLIKFLQALDTVLKPSAPSKHAVAEKLAAEPSAPPAPPPAYDEATSASTEETAPAAANQDSDRRKALLTAGGLLATGLLLGPDSGWSWGYGWGGSGAVSGPVFQDIDERELLAYCLPARGLRGIAGPAGCGNRGSMSHRYNRAYQRFNSDLGNDLDRWEEDQDRRAARRRSDAAADEAGRATTAEELGASLAVVSAAAAAAAGAEYCASSLQDFYDIGDIHGGYGVNELGDASNTAMLMAAAAAADDEDQFGHELSSSRIAGGCCPDTEATFVSDDAAMSVAATAADVDVDDALTTAALMAADEDLRNELVCKELDDLHLAAVDDIDAIGGRGADRDADDTDDLHLLYSEHLDASDGHCQGECGGDPYDCRDAAAEFEDLLRDEEDELAAEKLEDEVDYYDDRYGDDYGHGDDGFGGDDFGRDDDF